jgi:hypothetical protein
MFPPHFIGLIFFILYGLMGLMSNRMKQRLKIALQSSVKRGLMQGTDKVILLDQGMMTRAKHFLICGQVGSGKTAFEKSCDGVSDFACNIRRYFRGH